MAVEWGVDHTRGSEYLFDPADLVIKPDLNGRQEAPDVEPLIADILLRGQLQPVLVRSEGEGKKAKPVLVAGFSRWRAISEINKRRLYKALPLRLRAVYFRGNEQDGFLANMAENLQRNATTPLDDAHNVAMLEKWGMKPKEIAEAVKQREWWVRSRLKLVNLTPEAKTALKNGRLKATAAVQIAALAAEQQREAVKGSGPVKAAPVSLKPKVKAVREFVQTNADDTTASAGVRAFCKKLLTFIDGE